MVSIVIPYYNRPEKLNRALESVFNQTYKDFEVLLIDDCSDIKPELLPQHNVIYHRNSKNKGPGYSRNMGMQKAKGDYIAFLDADDYWHKCYLSRVVLAIKENQNCIMAYANGYYVDNEGDIIEEMRNTAKKPNAILPHIFVGGRPWGTSACLWSRLKLKDIKWVETKCWEDYVFDTNAAIICNSIVFVDDFLVYYDRSNDIDKLSKQKNTAAVEINRNQSLTYIAKLIENTHFYEDKRLINSLMYHSITNAIRLLNLNVKTKDYYRNIKIIIRTLGGKHKLISVNLILYLNKKLSLKFMRYFRKINSTN